MSQRRTDLGEFPFEMDTGGCRWQIRDQQGDCHHHANSYRFMSPLFLLSSSLSDCFGFLEGDKASCAASSNRGVSPALAGATGMSAGSSLMVDFLYAAGGRLAGSSFARGRLAGSALAESGLGDSGFAGGPWPKGTGPPAGIKIHCPRGCSEGGLSATW